MMRIYCLDKGKAGTTGYIFSFSQSNIKSKSHLGSLDSFQLVLGQEVCGALKLLNEKNLSCESLSINLIAGDTLSKR